MNKQQKGKQSDRWNGKDNLESIVEINGGKLTNKRGDFNNGKNLPNWLETTKKQKRATQKNEMAAT